MDSSVNKLGINFAAEVVLANPTDRQSHTLFWLPTSITAAYPADDANVRFSDSSCQAIVGELGALLAEDDNV